MNANRKSGVELWDCWCVHVRACVRVRLTEPCTGWQWVCTVWSSAAAWWWGFGEVIWAFLLAQVQAQTTLVLWAAQRKKTSFETIITEHRFFFNYLGWFLQIYCRLKNSLFPTAFKVLTLDRSLLPFGLLQFCRHTIAQCYIICINLIISTVFLMFLIID